MQRVRKLMSNEKNNNVYKPSLLQSNKALM